MNTRFGQSVEQAPAPAMQGMKEIPYDYVATFTLLGKRGNRPHDVINISVDGSFVAVAIGYSFIPAPTPPPEIDIFEVVSALATDTATDGSTSAAVAADDSFKAALQCVLIKMCGIDFKYSIVDSATGRELQNKFIHNIAGFGESNGNRPFRPMAKPILFQPRSTIRIEIEEISEGKQFEGAELYIVLHGYKMLGYGAGLS